MLGQQRWHFYTICYKFIQLTACKKSTYKTSAWLSYYKNNKVQLLCPIEVVKATGKFFHVTILSWHCDLWVVVVLIIAFTTASSIKDCRETTIVSDMNLRRTKTKHNKSGNSKSKTSYSVLMMSCCGRFGSMLSGKSLSTIILEAGWSCWLPWLPAVIISSSIASNSSELTRPQFDSAVT